MTKQPPKSKPCRYCRRPIRLLGVLQTGTFKPFDADMRVVTSVPEDERYAYTTFSLAWVMRLEPDPDAELPTVPLEVLVPHACDGERTLPAGHLPFIKDGPTARG